MVCEFSPLISWVHKWLEDEHNFISI